MFPIVGKFVDLAGLEAHVAALQFTAWRPSLVVVHNTSEPDLALYAEWRAHPENHGHWTPEKWAVNLQGFYAAKGWKYPHVFVCPDGFLLMNPLTAPGTHTPSWNAISWGVETVGEFESEPFAGPIRDNLIATLGILHARLGLNPTDYKLGVRGLHFHFEDALTTHRHCPGKNMVKADLVKDVAAYIESAHPGDHATIPAEAHTTPPVEPGSPPAQPAAAPTTTEAAIIGTVSKSAISSYRWRDRGVAPPGYVRGMALAFAQTYRRFKAGHPAAIEMAKANTGNDEHDAISWYNSNFRNIGMSNDLAGADTLRHLFVLMLGVGMRESSGKHCEGRDLSASNTSSDTAEAGLFQTSYDAHVCHPTFDQVMDEFAHGGGPVGYLSAFAFGVTCRQSSWNNFGAGRGAEFQRFCKEAPAFAAESAALTLRNLRKHYGTVNRKEAELRKEADDLFRDVQACVDDEAPSS